MNTSFDDTIAAVSSPLGQGGIGIIRMSGPGALAILKKIFRPLGRRGPFSSHRLHLGFIFDPSSGKDLDEVFAVYMRAPRTYTRQDVVEVYSHGGLSGQKAILGLMMVKGARLAEPGEFTKRAFLNGRIDLTQAESVLDIIESESAEELSSAVAHVKGQLSQRIGSIKGQMQEFLAEVEASIDFPDEGLEIKAQGWACRLADFIASLSGLVASFYEGRAIKQGLDVLIIGRANVGKSSLLNALALKERAIVTPMPGTTRDLIEDVINIKGIKFRITDTAGMRQPRDPIEKEGIDRVKERIPQADICLWVLDASDPYMPDDERVYGEIEGKEVVTVLNKVDLPKRIDENILVARGLSPLYASALTGSGLEALKDALYAFFADHGNATSALLITNVRHRDALARTTEALRRALACTGAGEPLEFLAFELRDALACVGEVTGETCPDEVLDRIFNRFCIGK